MTTSSTGAPSKRSSGSIRVALAERFETLSPKDQIASLRTLCRTDIEAFCRLCWPDRFGEPFNDLHRDLFEVALGRGSWRERTGSVRDARAAPRGHAKSTISSFALVAHRIAYGLEAFIVLASAEGELARDLSRDLHATFSDPHSPLARVFGPFKVTGGVDGWQVSVRKAPSVAVLPRSERSAVRGRKHPTRGIRPTLIVIDDGEDKVRVLNPRLRDFTWSWLTKDVLKAGITTGKGGTDVWVRGTVLHPESMLSRLISGKEHGWQAKKYRAIEAWPERADLWERCRQIWADLSLGDLREKAARAFYRANREEMERGAVVLSGLGNLFNLYQILWAEGLASFLQEFQNDPIDPSSRIFDPDRWSFCRVDGDEVVTASGRRIGLRSLTRAAWWDPTVGGPSGDFGAIAVGGRDQHGYTYVLDLWVRRANISEQLVALWSLCERWGVARAGYEDNGFQRLVEEPFPRQQAERREAGRFWRLDLVGETSTTNKVKRIAAMEPDTANGWIQFTTKLPAELKTQAAAFPSGSHDDALDAVERLWTLLGGTPVQLSDRPFGG